MKTEEINFLHDIELILSIYKKYIPEKHIYNSIDQRLIELISLKRLILGTQSIHTLLSNGSGGIYDSIIISRSMFETVINLYFIDFYLSDPLIQLYLDSFEISNKHTSQLEKIRKIRQILPNSLFSKKKPNPFHWCGLTLKDRCLYLGFEKLYEYFYLLHSQFTHSSALALFDLVEIQNKSMQIWFNSLNKKEIDESKYIKNKFYMFRMCLLDTYNYFYAVLMLSGKRHNPEMLKDLKQFLHSREEQAELIVHEPIKNYFLKKP